MFLKSNSDTGNIFSAHEKVTYHFVFHSKRNGNFPICCPVDLIGIY